MRQKKHAMDVILLVMAIFIVVFVGTMMWLYYSTGGIPDTLCTCVFAICGGECGVMGWIKTTKERTQERKYEIEDRMNNQKQEVEKQ